MPVINCSLTFARAGNSCWTYLKDLTIESTNSEKKKEKKNNENFCSTVELCQHAGSDMLKQKEQKSSPEEQKAALSNGNREIMPP